ncbi:MAG TPA: hypothetical protein VMZ30_16350 [Pyrinomonadaceae bacterium]|nr:hypothetical protein [Pyrinomonadaceae bacterium]
MSLTTESKKINNPFPGLRPFETDEYRLFFGREGQASALISRLERSHFLAIVGTSGSGKSSLVRAGLLPALRGGLMAGAGSGWRIAIMRPGSDPIGNLAAALADKEVLSEAGGGLAPAEALAVIEATLRRGSLGLVDAARQARLAGHDKLLVVVDQFEELFRFRAARPASSSGDDASAFVKLLLEAAQQRELQIYIVPTMRSDFLGDCAQFQGLPEAINDGQYLIPRMTRDERHFAITGPVGVTRGKISEPLVNRLMNDVGDNPDQLPILQHALMRTWDYWARHRRNGEPIGIEHYEAVGTMSDALSHHADEAFNQLPDERSRLVAEKLFKALTERGADNREIRRPTCLKDICAIAEAKAEEVIAVVDVFRGGGRSFLMPPAGVALKPDTVIDISHESLIRNWLRLKDWVNEEAQSARIYRRLAEAASLHREGSEGLLQDPGLQIALDWRQKANPNAAWARRYHPEFEQSLRYLDDSRAARDAAVAERERQRDEQIARERRELEQAQLYAEQQHRAARRLRYLSIGMAVMFVLALATAVIAFSARRHARQSEREALVLRDDAVKQQTVIASLLEREKGEKQKAREAEDAAKKQAAIADVEKKKAVLAGQAAVVALAQAQQQTKVAKAEKIKADEQRVIAEQEVKKNKRAREANDFFRDGVAYAQRGDYGNAGILLTQAIEGYEDPLVSNKEAVADAETQGGNFIFDIAYAKFIQENGNLDEPAMHDVQFFKTSFDRAASIYAEAPVNSPQKAAAALFTLGTMLLKLTKDEPGGDGRNRAALAELIEASSLDRPVPKLGFFSDRAGGKLPQQSDLSRKRKAEIEEQAVERYQKALEYYRKAGNYEGETKTAFQLGDFYMKKANTIASGHGDLSLISPSRQKAIHYFEQLMSPNATGPDPSRVRLLVWLGGLHQQLGNQPAADRYFGRAIETYQRDASWAKGGLAEIASIAEEVGQTDVAALYYAKAVAAFEAEGNLPLQAKALYSLGRVHEKLQDPGAFDKAIQYYRQAVRTTARAMEANKEATGELDELLRIGALAESIGDYQLALQAYEMTITSVGDSQADWRLLRAARAHSEIGSVFAETNKPMQALESYKRSQEIYTGLLKDSDAETKNEAKIEMQRLRKIITALLQTVPTK